MPKLNFTAMENNYYKDYLTKLLKEANDPRMNDLDFIDSRADLAQDEFNHLTRMGEPGFAAHELAMQTLLVDLENI